MGEKITKQISKFSVVLQINLGLAIVFIIIAVGLINFVEKTSKEYALEEAEEKIKIISDRNLATHKFFSKQLKPKVFELSDPFRSASYFEPTWMSSTYAVRAIDQHFRSIHGEGYYYKEAAINARSPENEANDCEKEFLEDLNKDPQLMSRSEIHQQDGKYYLVVMRRGERMGKTCLRCHSTPDKAPKGLVDIYGPKQSFHRVIGETIDVITIRVPLSAAYSRTAILAKKLAMAFLAALLILFTIQFLIYKFIIGLPLQRLYAKTSLISESHICLGETIPIPSSREFSKLSNTFNIMSVTLRKLFDNSRKRELQLTESQVVANLGSWDLNLVSQKLEWSNQTYSLFDKDTEEFIPSFDEYSRLVHPDDLETMQANFNNALLSDDIPYHVESRIINDSGRKWFMEAFGKVRRDTNGNAISIFGTAQDVTERKLAEASLKESEEKFRSIAENSPDLILILDHKANIRFINRTITGKSVEEVTGTNVYDSFSKKDNVMIKKALSQVSQTGKTGTFEISLTTSDFVDRIFECRIRPIAFQGDKQNLLVNASDITERKGTETALLNAHDELEQRVRKRTAELEQKSHSLKESNTALKILLRESGTLREEVEENIQLNLRESVLPYLDEVAALLPNKDLELYVDIVKSNIETITSSFSRSLSLEYKNLTPREIQVANFIRQGKTNKDIANILNVTVSAVDFHRRNIREKLNLKGKKANLRAHLLKYVG